MNILVTGGTSGLGFELVKQLAGKGHTVITTGRNEKKEFDGLEKLQFYRVDFRNLSEVAAFGYRIAGQMGTPDAVILNAGILSPSRYSSTSDGYEQTLQVNFLSQFLLVRILAEEKKNDAPLVIVPVISPVYKYGRINGFHEFSAGNYSRVKAYPSTKLYLALTGRFFADRYSEKGITAFCFDPGVFRSGIYRSQQKWFRQVYHFASPVLRNPAPVASGLIRHLEGGNYDADTITNRIGKISRLPESDPVSESKLWQQCLSLTDSFIR